ncbi:MULTISPECIES: hypothetical protein [unclassified Carboxylicivirga]|uniref:hypothetical protein n=1 Tax=Carboxylicivirga TaxID=1628153 RepID=UPI003D326CCC
MKKTVLMALIAILALPMQAQNTLSLDWGSTTNYMAHGRTMSANQACFQPGLYYGIPKGPTFMAWFSFPYDRELKALDEWNIIVDYNLDLLDADKSWNINLHSYADYWFLPVNEESNVQDYYQGMKYNGGIHLPYTISKLWKLKVSAGYDFYYYHQVGRDVGIRAGGIHEFLIKFNKSIKSVNLEAKSLISNNQGAVSHDIDPGWGFFSQHLSCSVDAKLVTLSTSVNYQRTMDAILPTGMEKHLFWLSINIGKRFIL